jgi:hypothetical protein
MGTPINRPAAVSDLPGDRGCAAKMAVLPSNRKRFKLFDAQVLKANERGAFCAEVDTVRPAVALANGEMHHRFVLVALGAEHIYPELTRE